MSLGAGLVAILLSPEAYWPIRRVGAEFHSAADGAVALEQILAHLEATNTPTVVERGGAPVRSTPNAAFAELEGVEYRYAVDLPPILRDLTLRLGPGLTVVTGPSGVGKSTLLELLAGLRTPTRGEVRAPAAHLVTQRPFIPAGTVRAAMTLGHPAEDSVVWEALRRVGLDGVVAALPGGLDATLGDDGFGLSAGQRQRIALTRAWLSTEPLVLLDEPTAHLDGNAARLAHELIAQLAERRVVVAVTHRPELLALAHDHVHLTPSSRDEVFAVAGPSPDYLSGEEDPR
jgi:ABC-type transport system involved in cytochrome bd biosynthesis fused ATPase/permease subunit